MTLKSSESFGEKRLTYGSKTSPSVNHNQLKTYVLKTSNRLFCSSLCELQYTEIYYKTWLAEIIL